MSPRSKPMSSNFVCHVIFVCMSKTFYSKKVGFRKIYDSDFL